MNCDTYKPGDVVGGREVVLCSRCGRKWTVPVGNNMHAACKAPPRAREIGHWAALLLSVFGITKSRYLWLKRIAGLKPSCRCNQREAALNTLGTRAQRFMAWLIGIFYQRQ